MGQCTSCESQRRGTPAAGLNSPSSPQIEFLPSSAFCLVSSATSDKGHGVGHSAQKSQNEGSLIRTTEDGIITPVQLTSDTRNLQPQSRSPDPLTNAINSNPSLPPPPPVNKGIRKVESKPRKYYRISPRNKSKSKVVTFSDPEVLDPVVKQSLISTSLRRIKFGKKPTATSTTTKLLPSPSFAVTDPNGPVNTEDTNTNTKGTDMGNNSSNQPRPAAVTPTVRSYRHVHVPKSSTFICNSKTRSSAISKQEDSAVPSSASANNILKSVNYNKVYNYEDVVNANKVPVSPQTLQDLNTSREEKKLLRDKFFSENSPSISIPIPKPACSTLTASPLTVSTESRDSLSPIPRTCCSSSPSKIPVPISSMGSIPRNGNRFPKTNNPVKEKRTFQYQPPTQTLRYSSSATQVPKLYSTEHVNGNINEGHEVLKSRSQSAITVGVTANASNPNYGLSNLAAQQQQCLRFPSASSYGRAGSGSTNEWKSGEDVFNSQTSLESGDFDPRRCSAPPKVLTQRRNNFGLNRAPAKLPSIALGTRIPEIGSNDGEDPRRHTLFGFNNKPVIKPIVPKKPIPTIPFFMLGPYGQSPPVTSTFKNGVSTGVVHQRKLFYQSQFSRGPPEPLKAIPIARSTTWVKDTAAENTSNLPKSQSTHLFGESTETAATSDLHSQVIVPVIPDPVPDSLNSNANSSVNANPQIPSSVTQVVTETKDTCPPPEVIPIPEEARIQQEHPHPYPKSETDSITSKTSSNFTGYREGSGTSTTSLSRSARSVSRDREHNVISDSEFLIDDEISDQPELTFTFKDSSSIILSPSSSEESLSSCDLMLDLTLASRENRSSVPNIVNDCKPAVVLPTPEPNIVDLVSGIQELAQELKVLQGALEEQQKVDAEKDQLIERLLLENERLRKSKGRCSGGDEDTKESKKVSCNSEKERKPVSFHRRPPPSSPRRDPSSPRKDTMINAAAQTESPSRKKGITYPDEKNDKVGQLVSFRIGRRPAPASNGKL